MSERYAFIKAEKAHFRVMILCRVLEVSRSGFYDFCRRKPSRHALENECIIRQIRKIHAASKGRYGQRRIVAHLRHQKIVVGRHRVGRLMRENGMKARWPRKFKATTSSDHAFKVAPNVLARKFQVDAPNQAVVGDITYVKTGQGWLYLAVLIDLFSRRVVGWSMGARIDEELTLRALRMALGQRAFVKNFIHHSDRGSQYAATKYRALLARAGSTVSMSRRGDCWDNAVSESFFSSIKTECIYQNTYATRDEARSDILKYLLWYNAERLHSTLGYVSPIRFEKQRLTGIGCA